MVQTKIADEIHAKPKTVLVHNPVISGCLKGINKANHLEKLYPFVPDVKACVNEHKQLVEHLHELGIKTIELFGAVTKEDQETLRGNPNTIFTRDPSVTFPWLPGTALICNMHTDVRQPEATAIKHAAKALGLKNLIEPPTHIHCEGGDIMPLVYEGKKTLLIRTGNRTDPAIVAWLLQYHPSVAEQIIEVRCLDRVLHLDSALGIAGTKAAVYDESSIKSLIVHQKNSSSLLNLGTFFDQLGVQPIPVSFDEAYRLQATNMLNVSNNTVIAYSGSRRIIKLLKELDVTVLGFDGHELAKGNGGPRCLTRPLY